MNQTIIMAPGTGVHEPRHPRLPVIYEDACRALRECVDLDEAKYWSDKAEALAAWAKIYHEEEAGKQAKRLKLKAFQRMSDIAEELRPGYRGGVFGNRGRIPGPKSLLMEHGLTRGTVTAVRAVGGLSKEKFAQALDIPLAPWQVVTSRGRLDPRWVGMRHALYSLHSLGKRCQPTELAALLTAGEVQGTRERVREVVEWLDAFEQALPK